MECICEFRDLGWGGANFYMGEHGGSLSVSSNGLNQFISDWEHSKHQLGFQP